ncbi:MAG: FHA domain-containing protein, partial [Kineosporiaceae bacterium]
TAVPDTRVAPTVRPEVRHGGVPVPEARAGQPPESVVPESVVPEPNDPDAVADREAEVDAAPDPEQPPGTVPEPEPGSEPEPQPGQESEPEPGSEPEPRAAVCHGVLEFDDGRRVEVDGPVIIGRAPSQVEGDRPARLVPVPEASRGLSRNHVRIDVGLQGPFVVDLGSRNGTTMRIPGRTAVRLDPWMPYPLDVGAELVFAQIICTFRGADLPSE